MNSLIKKLYNEYLKFPVITTDSRDTPKNSIFFALKGDIFDGNKFALQSIKKGCSLAVVDDPELNEQSNCFFVPDVLETLQELAKHHRSQFKIPVIGITGTNGKTTTKELVTRVLSKKYNTIATQGNLNNHIGVPLSILTIRKEHEIAILEMGANHIGEIEHLCQIVQPTHGLITNIGKAHLEGFGSFEGVIQAKSELYQYLRTQENPSVFVNNEDLILKEKSQGLNSFTYGISKANCSFNSIKASPFVEMSWDGALIKSKLIGKYNAENIMSAICIGHFFKVDTNSIISAIQEYTPKNQRSELMQTKNNKIILDAYNANPSSMKLALENFREMGLEYPFLILGDMFELGEFSLDEHQKVLELISNFGFENVILVGNDFYSVAQNQKYTAFKTGSETEDYLSKNRISNRTILIKGSRGMKLETLLPYL
jgi:UDP-N-acetylmuramoyl-tripeptide--D-alanyl-D-alanine ligase